MLAVVAILNIMKSTVPFEYIVNESERVCSAIEKLKSQVKKSKRLTKKDINEFLDKIQKHAVNIDKAVHPKQPYVSDDVDKENEENLITAYNKSIEGFEGVLPKEFMYP